MIQLTRLNGIPIVLNSDLIKTAEASPDTMLTLINGEKIIVREACDEVTERVLAYRARLMAAVARRLRGRTATGGIDCEPGCVRPGECPARHSSQPGTRLLNC